MNLLGIDGSSLERFSRFEKRAWEEWLELWLAGGKVDPEIPIFEGDLLEALAALFRALPEGPARLALSNAAVSLLKITLLDESSAQRLAILIGFISYSRPSSGQDVVRTLLANKRSLYIMSGAVPIHLLLLNAAGRYELDSWLLNYLLTRFEESPPLQHDLACFRILAQNFRPLDAFRVLDRVIPQLVDKSAENALRVELTHAVHLLGSADLLRYVFDRDLEFKYEESWKIAEEYFWRAMVSALSRYMQPHDLVDFVKRWPSDAGSGPVTLLARLHSTRRAGGSRLWDLDIVSENEFNVVVDENYYRLSRKTEGRVFAFLNDAVNQVSLLAREDTFEFDFQKSSDQYRDLKRMALAWSERE